MLKRHSMNINSREATHIVEKYVLQNKSVERISILIKARHTNVGDMQYCDTHEFMGKTFFLMDFS